MRIYLPSHAYGVTILQSSSEEMCVTGKFVAGNYFEARDTIKLIQLLALLAPQILICCVPSIVDYMEQSCGDETLHLSLLSSLLLLAAHPAMQLPGQAKAADVLLQHVIAQLTDTPTRQFVRLINAHKSLRYYTVILCTLQTATQHLYRAVVADTKLQDWLQQLGKAG